MTQLLLKTGHDIIKIPLSNLYYMTTHRNKPHVIVLVTEKGSYEVRTTLSELERLYDKELLRCHRHFLVNLWKIKAINSQTRDIVFRDEWIKPIYFSRRKYSQLLKRWTEIEGE